MKDKVLRSWWYSTAVPGLSVTGIVKVEKDGKEAFYIGSAEGEDMTKDIENILKYGSRLHLEYLV